MGGSSFVVTIAAVNESTEIISHFYRFDAMKILLRYGNRKQMNRDEFLYEGKENIIAMDNCFLSGFLKHYDVILAMKQN